MFYLHHVVLASLEYYADQAGLKLTAIHLPLFSEYWDSRRVPCLAQKSHLRPVNGVCLAVGVS